MHLVEMSRMDTVSTLYDKRLASNERKTTFHEISLWPTDVEDVLGSDGPRTPQKCGFYCIEILPYAALALIAYNSQL